MSEEEIFKHLEKMCILDPLCYEVDCLDEKDLQVLRALIELYNKQKDTLISQEKIIMEQEKQIQNYKKQVFGDILKGNYISKDKIRDKIKEYREQRIKLADGHFFDNPDNITNDYALFIAQEVLKQLLEEEQ